MSSGERSRRESWRRKPPLRSAWLKLSGVVGSVMVAACELSSSKKCQAGIYHSMSGSGSLCFEPKALGSARSPLNSVGARRLSLASFVAMPQPGAASSNTELRSHNGRQILSPADPRRRNSWPIRAYANTCKNVCPGRCAIPTADRYPDRRRGHGRVGTSHTAVTGVGQKRGVPSRSPTGSKLTSLMMLPCGSVRGHLPGALRPEPWRPETRAGDVSAHRSCAASPASTGQAQGVGARDARRHDQ